MSSYVDDLREVLRDLAEQDVCPGCHCESGGDEDHSADCPIIAVLHHAPDSTDSWRPPTVTLEREELERVPRQLRSMADLLPSRTTIEADVLMVVRDGIERDCLRAAESIERIIQEATRRGRSRSSRSSEVRP